MNMTNKETQSLLRLSIQRALLGEVTNQLFAVTASIESKLARIAGKDGKLIKIIAYYEGVVSAEDLETIQCVGAEVIADFPEGFFVDEVCLSLNENELQMLDFWAFMKKS